MASVVDRERRLSILPILNSSALLAQGRPPLPGSERFQYFINIEMNWELGAKIGGFQRTEGARGPLNLVSV